jgi:hypothetical protein
LILSCLAAFAGSGDYDESKSSGRKKIGKEPKDYG